MVLKAVFSKIGAMRYISHLDLMRLFQRSARRSGIPVTITQGFSPHLKLSIERALKLGVESRNERATFYLSQQVDPGEFARRMNAHLPDDIQILEAKEVIQ